MLVMLAGTGMWPRPCLGWPIVRP